VVVVEKEVEDPGEDSDDERQADEEFPFHGERAAVAGLIG
jgi:hypothetical protein